MGRRKIHSDIASRVRAFRIRHLDPIVISKTEYEQKANSVRELIGRLGYDYDKVVNVAFPTYVKWFKDRSVDIHDEKDCDKFDSIMSELTGEIAKPEEYLNCEITVYGMFWDILNFVISSDKIKCPCGAMLYPFEDRCSCGRGITITKNLESNA